MDYRHKGFSLTIYCCWVGGGGIRKVFRPGFFKIVFGQNNVPGDVGDADFEPWTSALEVFLRYQ